MIPAVTFAAVWSKAWPILLGILFFGLIITIHELGHFAFAKLFKVKINEFSIGMGPAIFKRKKGDTDYALRLFPVGGYVAMDGEDGQSEDENAFCKKAVWKRMIIVVAGATMNIILGFLLFSIIISRQDLVGTTTVAKFDDNAVSSTCGLQVGDRIIKVDGTRVFTNSDLSYALTRGKDNRADLTVVRDGEKLELENVGFLETEIDGRTYVVRDFFFLGKENNFFRSLTHGVVETVATENLVRMSLVDMVTGKYGLKDLSGPIGTMQVISQAASDIGSAQTSEERSDALYFLIYLMAFITVNIGVVNLLPIPALDGGRLFFLVIEAIRRKPILPKYEGYVHAAGLVLLLLLIAVVSAKDIIYLFK